MEFITIVLAWALVQYWGSASPVHRDGWFLSLLSIVQGFSERLTVRLLLGILLPALIMTWLVSAFSEVLFGLVYLLLNILLLLYCMGRGDFSELIGEYRQRWLNEDYESAYLFACSRLGIDQEDQISETGRLNALVKQELLYRGYERWFATVFYFLLIGVLGALLYRLVHLYRVHSKSEAERHLLDSVLAVADWLPARLLSLAFAITGDFVATMAPLIESLTEPLQPVRKLLSDSARVALVIQDDRPLEEGIDELSAIQGLLSRSAIAWLAVIAFITLLC